MLSSSITPYIAPFAKVKWYCGDRLCEDSKERIRQLKNILKDRPELQWLVERLGLETYGANKETAFMTGYLLTSPFCVHDISDGVPVSKCQKILTDIETVSREVFERDVGIAAYVNRDYIRAQLSLSQVGNCKNWVFFAIVLVDDYTEQIVGYVDVTYVKLLSEAYIGYLFVAPNYRGLHIANILLYFVDLFVGKVLDTDNGHYICAHEIQERMYGTKCMSHIVDIPMLRNTTTDSEFALYWRIAIDCDHMPLLLHVHDLCTQYVRYNTEHNYEHFCLPAILKLHVSRTNDRAIKLYTIHGFIPECIVPGYYASAITGSNALPSRSDAYVLAKYYAPITVFVNRGSKQMVQTEAGFSLHVSGEIVRPSYAECLDDVTVYPLNFAPDNESHKSPLSRCEGLLAKPKLRKIKGEGGGGQDKGNSKARYGAIETRTCISNTEKAYAQENRGSKSNYTGTGKANDRASDITRQRRANTEAYGYSNSIGQKYEGKDTKYVYMVIDIGARTRNIETLNLGTYKGNERKEHRNTSDTGYANKGYQNTHKTKEHSVKETDTTDIDRVTDRDNGDNKEHRLVATDKRHKHKQTIRRIDSSIRSINAEHSKRSTGKQIADTQHKETRDDSNAYDNKTEDRLVNTVHVARNNVLGYGSMQQMLLVTETEVLDRLDIDTVRTITIKLESKIEIGIPVPSIIDRLVCEYKWTTYQSPAKKPYRHFLMSLQEKMHSKVLAGKVEVQLSPRLWYTDRDNKEQLLYWLALDFDAKHVGNNIDAAYRDCLDIAKKARNLGLKTYICPSVNGFHLLILHLFDLDKTEYSFANIRANYRSQLESKYASLDVISSFRLTPFRGPGTTYKDKNLFMIPYTVSEFMSLSPKQIQNQAKTVLAKIQRGENVNVHQLASKILDAWTLKSVIVGKKAIETVFNKLFGI